MKVTDEMVNRFLSWPLPKSVCSDLCATMRDYQYPRSGTTLLDVNEARQMLEHVLATSPDSVVVPREPTKEMLEAACKGPAWDLINDWLAEMQLARGRKVNWSEDDPPIAQAYRAMLAAAPKGDKHG